MPITTSAKKALRGSRRKRDFNLARKKVVSDAIKKFKKLTSEKKVKDAQALWPQVQKALDKAVKKNVLKKNTAARMKSRFVKMLKKVS